MKSLLATLLLATALPVAHADVNVWNFRVLLDDREIGRHQFTLRSAGGEHELRSEARFDVRVLLFSAYRYKHVADERWDGDCLQSLVSRTETNGERQAVNATESGGRLVVDRPAGRAEHGGCVMSFAYWNPRILEARRLLNAQTGELVPVTVTPQGDETIAVRKLPVAAQRYRISGPGLQVDIWYSGGRWVALEAPAAGTRRLRYELI
ncbi:MAG: DUF6134 family protein [Steroidobacteraceae bacterium]